MLIIQSKHHQYVCVACYYRTLSYTIVYNNKTARCFEWLSILNASLQGSTCVATFETRSSQQNAQNQHSRRTWLPVRGNNYSVAVDMVYLFMYGTNYVSTDSVAYIRVHFHFPGYKLQGFVSSSCNKLFMYKTAFLTFIMYHRNKFHNCSSQEGLRHILLLLKC